MAVDFRFALTLQKLSLLNARGSTALVGREIPCYARPVAASIKYVESALVRSKSSNKFDFYLLARCIVEPSVENLGLPLSLFTFNLE